VIRRRVVLSLLSAVAVIGFAVACTDVSTSSPPPASPSPSPVAQTTPPRSETIVMPPVLVTVLDVPADVARDVARDHERSLLDVEAVAVTEGDVVDHRADGARLAAAGDVSGAISEYKQALSVDSSADVWAALGDAYLKNGSSERGVACLDEAVSIDVDNLAARRLLTRHFLAAQQGQKARQHAEEWVRVQPQDANARQALGRAFSQVGMWKEAIDEFALVVDVQKDNAFAFNNLGFAALQLGDNERAAHSLERVLSLKPQQGFMLNNLGVAYERLGRTAEAHAAFARAAELSPKYAQAALNRDRVQRGMDHAQRVVSNDALLKLRDGLFEDVPPLGTGFADGVDLPALPSADGE